MSEAVAVPQGTGSKPVMGVTNGKFAMWLFLGSDGMSFMGLIAAYVALRWGKHDVWPSPAASFAINLTAFNTFVLICSSVSMVKAFAAAQTGNVAGLKFWLFLTILGGAFFLGVQAYEYNELIFHDNLTLSTLPAHTTENMPNATPLFGATFYGLTCFHGFHVLSGVIYLSIVLILVFLGSWTVNRIEIVGLYWHFVDLVWIVIFTIVYLVE